MNATPTTDVFPDEVLELIFSKLSLRDRKIARLVNKRWLSVGNSASLTKNELVKLKLENLPHLEIFRNHLNLKINADFDKIADPVVQLHDEFWIKHGNSIRSLNVVQMQRLSIEEPTERLEFFQRHLVQSISNHCFNITELSLTFFEQISPLDMLRYLRANDFVGDAGDDDNIDAEWNDDTFHRDDSSAVVNNSSLYPKLTRLTSLSIAEDNAVDFITGPEFLKLTESIPNLTRLVLGEIPDCRETIENVILALIAKQSTTLTEIVFRDCKFTSDTFLDNVLKLLGPQLSSLHLVDQPLDKPIDCLKTHAHKLANLRNLEFYGPNLNQDFSGLLIFKNLSFISCFNTNFSNNDLALFLLELNLKGLSIQSTKCTGHGISECFERKVYPNLVALQLEAEGLTDEVLTTILPKLPNLKFLDLSSSSKLRNTGVQAIVSNCKLLTHLVLASCVQISSVIEPVSINGLINLVHLSVDGCSSLDPCNIPQLSFNKLRSIGLFYVSLSEEGLKELLKNCPNLVRLNLYEDKLNLYSCGAAKERGILFNPTEVTIFDFSTKTV